MLRGHTSSVAGEIGSKSPYPGSAAATAQEVYPAAAHRLRSRASRRASLASGVSTSAGAGGRLTVGSLGSLGTTWAQETWRVHCNFRDQEYLLVRFK